MLRVVWEKFNQNPSYAERLLDTYPLKLRELNNWGDRYWGMVKVDGEWVGDNELGLVLLLVRLLLMIKQQLFNLYLDKKAVDVVMEDIVKGVIRRSRNKEQVI